MQITHDNKTYKWIGDKWGTMILTSYSIHIGAFGEIYFKMLNYFKCLETSHTLEQLVKLGYMELINKPEEKPTECCHSELSFCSKCSPVIPRFSTNHYKAMEIPEVKEFIFDELIETICESPFVNDTEFDRAIAEGIASQLEDVTNSLNLLIKAHNNK